MAYRRRMTITVDEAIILFDGNPNRFYKLTQNVYCGHCDGYFGKNVTEIVNYKIWLEKRNDIILEGHCKKCNGSVARFIETGEHENIHSQVDKIYEKRRKKNRA
jgi:hypothetical protein